MRNWEDLVLGALGAKDPQCHPIMWIRLWFDNDGKAHQRARSG